MGLKVATALAFCSSCNERRSLYDKSVAIDASGLRSPPPKMVLERVMAMESLTSLNVGNSGLDQDAAIGLVRSLRQRDRLIFLDLKRCVIDARWPCRFMRALRSIHAYRNMHVHATTALDPACICMRTPTCMCMGYTCPVQVLARPKWSCGDRRVRQGQQGVDRSKS
jgi:hypothetical protein